VTVTREGAVRIEVAADPRAHVSRIAAVRAGAVVVKLAASPTDGAANRELVTTLASSLQIPRRDVVIVRGETARIKLVEVHGLAADEVRARLQRAIG
jgi:uncharacterized protein (TIGR00251 family)